MKRIRTMVLVACAALALTAAADAGTASASRIVPETGATVLNGSLATEAYVDIQGMQVTCTGFDLEGSAFKATTFEAFVANGNCDIWGGTTPIKMNGCDFTFHPGGEISSGYFGGTFDIGPANCGPMTMEAPGCKVTIYPKTGLTAHYTNIGEGSKAEVLVELQAKGLKTTGEGGACSKGSQEKIEGTWNLKARDNSHVQKGVHIAELPQVPLYIAGKKSEETGSQPKFYAEEYPALLTGSQYSENILYTEGGYTECTSIGFTSSISQSSPELSLVPTFSGCTIFGLESKVLTKGCYYVAHVANAGPPYTGSLALSCSTGGKLEIVVRPSSPICTVTFSGQTLGSTSYTNEPLGTPTRVLATTYGAGLQYSVVGGKGACGKEGSHSDGEFEGGIKLEGK